MFEFDISDELKPLIKRINIKDKKKALIIDKKINEIINNDNITIDRYKNCKYDLKDCKRAHIGKSFVLLFKVYKKENMIYFWKLKHHDNIYN